MAASQPRYLRMSARIADAAGRQGACSSITAGSPDLGMGWHRRRDANSALVDVPDEVWSVADRFLLDRRIVEALVHLQEVGGLSLHDAIVAVNERVGFLKANHAECFTVPLETSGQDFYS